MIKKIKTNSHEEWLELRSHYIGGSDAGAIIGMNPYKSAYTLWAEKTKKIEGFKGNIITKVGSYLEELVAQMFAEETGKKVHRENQSFVNDLYPFAIANIDRAIVGEDAGLEIKTTNSFPLMKTLRNSDEFPEAYYCQCVHYMAVTGKAKWYLAVLIECRELKIYELERDQAEIDALMQAEADFWKLVETNMPPAVDGAESTGDTLKLLYPESDGSKVDLMPLGTTLDEYTAIKAQIGSLEELLEEKVNIIKEYMGEAETGEFEAYKVSYKTQAGRASFDYKQLFKDRPDMDFSNYLKQGNSYRVFKITEKTKKENK